VADRLRRDPGARNAFHAATLARLPLLLASLLYAGCGEPTPPIAYEVVATFPHDPDAYTQGLLFHDGYLFESTGRYGASSLRKVDVQTGRVVARRTVDSAYFAEGLALVGSELVQLTWKKGVAFVYDMETLEPTREIRYDGEGWGLCFDGDALYMSNGSSSIVRRDPESFEIVAEIPVRERGAPVSKLNELECVNDFLYANVYQTDRIVRIDKRTGDVVGHVDGFQLGLLATHVRDPDAVLNGIAFIPETGIFLLTGKLWPKLFAVRLESASPGADPDVTPEADPDPSPEADPDANPDVGPDTEVDS